MTDSPAQPPDESTDSVSEIVENLNNFESQLSSPEKQAEIQHIRDMVEMLPGSDHISKYTSRDMGEAFIGALVFSVPLLVEDGVFEIAEWFLTFTLGPIPVLLVANIVFIISVTIKLLYAVDFREVQISEPVFGFIPRRLIGVLVISFLCALGMMLLWGRLHDGNPSQLEAFSRVTVIWAAAALGAVLADILPGESKGKDINELVGTLTNEE